MILVQSGLEWSVVVVSRAAELLVVGVGVVQVVIVKVLLLAPYSPGRVCQGGEDKRTTDSSNDTTDDGLG